MIKVKFNAAGGTGLGSARGLSTLQFEPRPDGYHNVIDQLNRTDQELLSIVQKCSDVDWYQVVTGPLLDPLVKAMR